MVWQSLSISIHTSAREVTRTALERGWQLLISIHTSAREVTLPSPNWMLLICYFNPHFRKGSDRTSGSISAWKCHFNPHFRKGSDTTERPQGIIFPNFNPHFRKGSDSPIERKGGDPCRFQSTLPQGKWPLPFLFCTGKSWFQSTLPQGKWLTPLVTALVPIVFQSTLPQGKWRWSFPSVVRRLEFQSTLPQGKWRNADGRLSSLLPISIHTSAREVTVNVVPAGDGFIFQSTLPQGKWRGQDGYAGSFGKFQSTLPQGKWRNINLCKCSRWGISIHTSAREVTRSLETRTGRTNFNPHFRKGSDSPAAVFAVFTGYFNPHFRKGSDLTRQSISWFISIFQSTLPQGKWRREQKVWWIANQFQSTLPQGKWQKTVLFLPKSLNFNPHFRKGSDDMTWMS